MGIPMGFSLSAVVPILPVSGNCFKCALKQWGNHRTSYVRALPGQVHTPFFGDEISQSVMVIRAGFSFEKIAQIGCTIARFKTANGYGRYWSKLTIAR